MQVGNQNEGYQRQIGTLTATLTSTGNRNYGEQTQVGRQSSANGTQLGDDNYLMQNQGDSGDGGSAQIQQTGDRNRAMQSQAGFDQSALIVQGDGVSPDGDNTAKQMQTGAGHQATARQLGARNSARQEQLESVGNRAEISQEGGDGNQASQVQRGIDLNAFGSGFSSVRAQQVGNRNRSEQEQVGNINSNAARSVQNGSDNVARQVQGTPTSGAGFNTASIDQLGNANRAEQQQLVGFNQASIEQDGNAHQALQTQDGIRNQAYINQEGSGHVAAQTQAGNENLARTLQGGIYGQASTITQTGTGNFAEVKQNHP